MSDDIAQIGYCGTFSSVPFGIRDRDRTSHLYIVGKTGTGKSTLLENLMIRDIAQGNGFAFIDPHGTHAQTLLDHIPPERIQDTLYFNVADREYPIAFNPLAHVHPDDRPLITDALVSSFKHIFKHAWGEGRMEQLIYNTIAALLDTENATLLGVRRMLVSDDYRKHVIAQVRDPEVRAYWLEDFGTWAHSYRREAIAPVLNKICQLFTSPLTRNILGQPTSAFDIGEIMDNQRILIVNLSKGKVGHRAAKLLGSFLISQFHLSAMRRDPNSEDHSPFNVYIDEFTTFATDAFSEILSECRKYGLSLTLAHQYIEQMSEETRAAIFGNVGTLAVFRVGQRDAKVLEQEFSHPISASTMVELDNHRVCMRLLDQGASSPPFQAATLPKPAPQHLHAQDVITTSRALYSRPRVHVESAIYEKWYPSFSLTFAD